MKRESQLPLYNTPFLFFRLRPADYTGIPEHPVARFFATPVSQIILLVILSGLAFTVNVGSWGMNNTECFFAQMAKEMMRSHDYLTPHFNGAPNFTVPPFSLWLMTISFHQFGINQWAAVLPGALAGIGIVLLTYFFGQWLFRSYWQGFLSSLIVMTTFAFVLVVRSALPDIFLTLFFLMAAASFFAAKYETHWWYIVCGVSIGLGVLTQSVLGLFPMICIFLYIIVNREWERFKQPMFWAGVAVALAISSWWYIYECVKYGDAFINGHFMNALYARSFLSISHKTLWFYLAPLKLLLHAYEPWFLFALAGMTLVIIDYLAASERSEIIFLVIWALTVWVVMAFSAVKEMRFLLSSLIPCSILTALIFQRTFKKMHSRTIITYILAAIVALPLIWVASTPFVIPNWTYKQPHINKIARAAQYISPDSQPVMLWPTDTKSGLTNTLARNEIESLLLFYSGHPVSETNGDFSSVSTWLNDGSNRLALVDNAYTNAFLNDPKVIPLRNSEWRNQRIWLISGTNNNYSAQTVNEFIGR